MAHSIANIHPAQAAPVGGVFARISRAFALTEQRHKLSELDDSRLEDLGLSRAEAQAEARRPFWDAPKGWKA